MSKDAIKSSTARRSRKSTRRTVPRLVTRTQVSLEWCTASGAKKTTDAHSVNLSMEGVAVELGNEQEFDASLVEVRLRDGVGDLQVGSSVAWSALSPETSKKLVGLRFEELTSEKRSVLKSLIDRLLKEKRSKYQSDRRPYDYCNYYVNSLKEFSIHIDPKVIDGPAVPSVNANGEDVISLCSNNALGMAFRSEVITAACNTMQRYGTSCGSSRLIAGNLSLQVQLEKAIASYMDREAAIVFMTGYMANMGALLSLTNARSFKGEMIGSTTVFCDRENHNSIIMGCRLAESVNHAEIRYYRHRDVQHLRRLLEDSPAERKVIITEGVFSMIGDVAPLREIVALAREFSALTFLDDSHAIGMLGSRGQGTMDMLNEFGPDIVMGTFSKAFGAIGGFVTGKKEFVDYIKVQAPTYIFTSALPPATVGGILKAIELVKNEPTLRTNLASNSDYFKKRLIEAGFTLLDSGSHIVPILIGESEKAVRISEKLFEKGTFIQSIPWPAVPKNRSILRCIATALHTRQHLDKVIGDLVAVGREEGVIPA